MVIIKTNESLSGHNTFGFNVNAAVYAEYDSVSELIQLLDDDRVKSHMQDFWSIGQGSNLLFSGNYDGLILHGNIKGIKILVSADKSSCQCTSTQCTTTTTNDRTDISCDGTDKENDVNIHVGAGEVWDDVCEWAVSNGLYGTENLSAIPGEVGAACVQNIGAYGAEFGNLVKYVEVLDIESKEIIKINRADCHYAYRDSIFKHQPVKSKYIVTGVVLTLQKTAELNLGYGNIKSAMEDKELNLRNLRDTIISIRGNKLPDPKVFGNAGSFFKNPIVDIKKYQELKAQYENIPSYPIDDTKVKVPAGWLIEHCGLKGKCIGGAKVYEKQCLVLINYNNAMPQDVVSLSNYVIETVKNQFGIEISPEVNII